MKNWGMFTAAGILLFVISACSSRYDYYQAARNRTNLSGYHTFAWMQSTGSARSDANAADAAIKDAATAELTQKGLILQQRSPDVLVAYTHVVGRGSRTNYYNMYNNNFYGGWGYGGLGYGGFGWGGWNRPYYNAYGAPFSYAGTSVTKENFKEGTLVIDVVDRRSKQLVWRGYGVGEVHRDQQKNIEDLPKVVAGILDQLSLAPSSAAPAGGRGFNNAR